MINEFDPSLVAMERQTKWTQIYTWDGENLLLHLRLFILSLRAQNSNKIAFKDEILKFITALSIFPRNCRGSIKHHKSHGPSLLFGAFLLVVCFLCLSGLMYFNKRLKLLLNYNTSKRFLGEVTLPLQHLQPLHIIRLKQVYSHNSSTKNDKFIINYVPYLFWIWSPYKSIIWLLKTYSVQVAWTTFWFVFDPFCPFWRIVTFPIHFHGTENIVLKSYVFRMEEKVYIFFIWSINLVKAW